jgi:hypothetical protein
LVASARVLKNRARHSQTSIRQPSSTTGDRGPPTGPTPPRGSVELQSGKGGEGRRPGGSEVCRFRLGRTRPPPGGEFGRRAAHRPISQPPEDPPGLRVGPAQGGERRGRHQSVGTSLGRCAEQVAQPFERKDIDGEGPGLEEPAKRECACRQSR